MGNAKYISCHFRVPYLLTANPDFLKIPNVIFNCMILIGGWFHGKPYKRPSKEDIETEIPLEPVDIDEDEFYSWIKYELITSFSRIL